MTFLPVLQPELFPRGRKFRDDEPKKKGGRGCEVCPLDRVIGLNKVKGEVRGKEIFVWGMAPGPQENKEQKEFIGPSGEFLWEELRRVGIKRGMCDIQNVVRCFPADRNEDMYPPLKMRNPTKVEIKACSVYTDDAIKRSEAKIHLIFGEVAQRAVLGTEYKKNSGILWSDKLNGWAVPLYHPSYFLRMGYRVGVQTRPNRLLLAFRKTLIDATDLLDEGETDKYGYMKKQNYYGITNRYDAYAAKMNIRKYAKKGRRIAVDIEDGILKEGRRAALVCGFSRKAGEAYVFVLDHEEGVEISDSDREYNWWVVRGLLSDPKIRKVLHHGSYDAEQILKLMDVEIQGYDYDTEWAEYFVDPDAKAYGLQSIASRRYQKFGDYKSICAPEALTESYLQTIPKNSKMPLAKKYEAARTRGELNMAQVPWEKMVLYNGADADITKRIEVSTKNKINMALMGIYRDAGFLMADMEKFGPLFDYKQCDKLFELYPKRVTRVKRKLRRIADRKDFNPGSPDQVGWLLFTKLGLDMPGDGSVPPNTQIETLEQLEGQHEAVGFEMEFRKYQKILSTYLEGFLNSANKHEGRLATKWWLTGTRTGRMSSGAGRDKVAKLQGLVNLQNIISDHHLQNMLVSTLDWREIYRYWKENGDFNDITAKKFEDMDVFLGFDQGQFEMRVVAQRSGDKELIQVFERDEDIHAYVGNSLMGLPLEKILEEGPERVAVKGMHFGIVYGLKAKGLWETLVAQYKKKNITPLPTLQWVKDLLEKYFKRFWKVQKMIEGDQKMAEDLGYVETMFGFRRPINVQEQKDAGSGWTGSYWMNQASNTPIQGTAHQLLLLGLVNIIRQKEKYKLLRRAQMEVHDAMYFIIKLKDIWKAILLGIELLQDDALKVVREDFGIDWKVPLKVEPKAGFRFGVQVYKVGGKGPKTTAEFLNAWARKNRETEIELRKEMETVKDE